MYNVPWQDGRVYRTPIGILAASFLLRPNTMFHPEGEWSVRLVLPPLQAYRLRQLIAPAYDDVISKAKDLYLRLPLEQQAHRPFRENAYWQAASMEGGLENENVYFTFRLPAIDRSASTTLQAIGTDNATPAVTPSEAAEPGKRKRKPSAKAASSKTASLVAEDADAATSAAPAKSRRKKADAATPTVVALDPAVGGGATTGSLLDRLAPQNTVMQPAMRPDPNRVQEVATRVPLLDLHGQDISHLTLEPDGWDAEVSFSIQQYWLRSFGAGVTLRLQSVQLFGLHQRQGDSGDEMDPPLSIAL
jgi:hypothetical protein